MAERIRAVVGDLDAFYYVIGELVAARMYTIIDKARGVADAWECVSSYVTDRRDLLYREPAFTDALLMRHPGSKQLVALARTATDATDELIRRGHEAGVVRREFTTGDLYHADVGTGLALRELRKPSRADYDRRTRFFLDGLRAS